MKEKFTFETAIHIQMENLIWWKSILNAETYEKLEKHVLESNQRDYSTINPQDIMRGQDLLNFIYKL